MAGAMAATTVAIVPVAMAAVAAVASVAMKGRIARRVTAKAPQALAHVALVAWSSPLSQPRRKPDMKLSPAPSTL